MSILGKHTKRITCGAWSVDSRLALGGDDRQVTVSRINGDTVTQLMIKGEPRELKFAPEAAGSGTGTGTGTGTKKLNQMSINVGGNTLYLYKLGENDQPPTDRNPMELAFQNKYGKLVQHHWFGDGYLLIGFETGYLVVMSTHNSEVQEELHSAHMFTHGALEKMSYCRETSRVAVSCGPAVKLVDVANGQFNELKEDTLDFDAKCEVTCLGWALDGQVLTVATTEGHVYTFLASLPTMSCAFGPRLAYLTSLLEVSVADLSSDKVRTIAIDSEPAFLALGDAHVAAGMNNQAWFYRIGPPSEAMEYTAQRVNQRDYLGTVDEVALNDKLAAVRFEGRVSVHVIDHAEDPTESSDFQLPEAGKDPDISCIQMTNEFLVYGTQRGTIHYFYLPDRVSVNEYRHEDGAIKSLYLNSLGTRLVFVDASSVPAFFNPVNDQVLPIPNCTGPPGAVLWDAADPNCFVIANGTEFLVYTYAATTINGPMIESVGKHPQQPGTHPVLMLNGVVACQGAGGKMTNELLSTHAALQDDATVGERGKERFARALNLNRLQDAWEVAVHMQHPDMWEQLAHRAMTHMEIEFAIRVYRFVGDASMVLSLERLAHLEDKNLLAGNILMLFERDDCYDMAQELFVRSGCPQAALQMRKDLKHWEKALSLAKQADPSQLDDICREYASLLEMRGEFDLALEVFSRAVQYPGQGEPELAKGRGGVARCTLHLGDIRRGKQMAMDSGSAQLCRECAQILEGMNQPSDAAALYEKGGQYEKAASIYIATKNFNLAKPLMDRVSTPKLHLQYARAKEAEGKLAEAADAYEMARDFDAVVRLQLEHLGNPQKAFALVRMSRSAEGALMVAQFCRRSGDHGGAIEFLLLARRGDEAFALAQENEEMPRFVEILGDAGTPEEYERLAAYFESKGDFSKAGDLHARCAQYPAAVRNFLKVGAHCIDKAIEVVGKASSDALTNLVLDYLMGETDGVEKDHNYQFRLHIALRNYDQAARTSVIIARQEQEMGNYKIAHTQLFDTFKELMSEGKKPPAELSRQLMLLHSYVLVKVLVKLGDHPGAARMLTRVAKNISKFPAHVVPILTSTVIECQRAGLKRTALEYATKLMAPELRPQIAEAYKRKIETIVRKPDKTEASEEYCPCPFCNEPGPETELACDSCKRDIPFCVASGKRMRVADWAQCPSCRFPCNASAFVKTIAQEKTCPMCSQQIVLAAIKILDDPLASFRGTQAAANEE